MTTELPGDSGQSSTEAAGTANDGKSGKESTKRRPGEALELVSVAAGPERDRYLPLLLLADEAELQVRSYYQTGDLFALRPAGAGPEAEAIGMVLAVPHGEAGAVELKAVAIAEGRQNQGWGQRMLALVLAELRGRGVSHVVVGTGNSGIGQLAFYQKAGFRLSHIERDFFTPACGYPPDLEENGIPLRDMVWMEQELVGSG